ncbi:MAG: hypothetical protein ABIA04_15140 [Pseudomonadota bacterium]
MNKRILSIYLIIFTCFIMVFTSCSTRSGGGFWGYPSMPASEYLARAKKILYVNEISPPLKNSLGKPSLSEAKKLLELYLKQLTHDSDAINLYAIVLKMSGDTEDALINFQKAIDIQPDNEGYRFNIYNTYFDLGRFEEAMIGYRWLIENKPDIAIYRLNLAKACENTSNLRCALENYQIVFELDRENVLAKEKFYSLNSHFENPNSIKLYIEKFESCFKEKPNQAFNFTIAVKKKLNPAFSFINSDNTPIESNTNRCLLDVGNAIDFKYLKNHDKIYTYIIDIESGSVILKN